MESRLALVLVICFIFLRTRNAQNLTTLVPAIIIFGDSAVDVGNNNFLSTNFKANFPPYGRDFVNQTPTGRFCNGKLATDLTAETLGFKSYPPAYLSPQASGDNLLIGANFASAGSGYDEMTAERNVRVQQFYLPHAILLSRQLQLFKEYQTNLTNWAGQEKAATIINDAIYILSAGSSDFLLNYYVNPSLYMKMSPDQYATLLATAFSGFVKDLYSLGARKIGVTSLPPLGCLPAAFTLFGFDQNECVESINKDAQGFNNKINTTATDLENQLPDTTIVVFNIYQTLYDLVQNPSNHSFEEARRGCCGTGTVETKSLFCNPESVGICANATQYVFWDSVHPSQAANQILADALITQGISLI